MFQQFWYSANVIMMMVCAQYRCRRKPHTREGIEDRFRIAGIDQ